MIDLHCHILPGVDDGPQSIEESLALARVSARAGTCTIVATPHVSSRYHNDLATIARGVEQVNEALAAESCAIEVLPGAEIAASRVSELDPEELNGMTLGGGPWLLLEPPFTPVATGFDEIGYSLMRRGLRVVIAHPERCAGFHRDTAMLGDLVRTGAITSITAGSLAGRFGERVRRFAMKLMDEDMVHNVASDAHDEIARRPGIAAEIESVGLGELREWLTELVPASILSGDPIPARPAFRTRRRRRLLSRLRDRTG